MALVHVTEFRGIAVGAGPAQVATGIEASQSVAIGGASAAIPNVFSPWTTIFRVLAEDDCYICWGVAPNTATDKLFPMVAGAEAYLGCGNYSGWKVAVIERTVA